MRSRFSAQSEIFAFLAMFFLLGVIIIEERYLKIEEANEVIERLRREAEAARLEAEAARRRYPPIVILSEEEQRFRFELGSAEVPFFFQEALERQVIPELDRLSENCDCDTIEVVGHTDEVRVGSRSNLDSELIQAFAGSHIQSLTPGSNMDLGMMRALAITSILKDQRQAGTLQRIQYFLPYSAGQVVLTDRSLASAATFQRDPARRRIEIRLLRSTTKRLNFNNPQ